MTSQVDNMCVPFRRGGSWGRGVRRAHRACPGE